MYALTIHPEWAKAIIDGHKDVENRSWQPVHNYRGTLYIHSSVTNPDPKNLEFIEEITGIKYHPKDLIQGAIIGSVQLQSVERFSESPWAIPNFYHWKLSSPILFEKPIKIKGKQKMWSFFYTDMDRILRTKFLVKSNFKKLFASLLKDVNEEALIELAVKYNLHYAEVKSVLIEIVKDSERFSVTYN